MSDTRETILSLKKQENAIILAHNYQPGEVQEIADFNGDSLELARRCLDVAEETIVFCGVYFMAETAKILNPGKTVLLPSEDAGCRMADMADAQSLKEYREKHPDTTVVCYINSTAEVKALSDVCVTSSNALTVVRKLAAKRVLFVPDRNLGSWIAKQLPDTEFDLWPGYCYVHDEITRGNLLEARRNHPGVEIIVHPECPPEVSEAADRVLSTGQMRSYISRSDGESFIIGTEEGMLYRLASDNPGKTFYPVKTSCICEDMKRITLPVLEASLQTGRHRMEVDPAVATDAKRAIDRMLELS
ncbi:MAG: quinolinate synthase NadA [Spirochaetota bacterium]